MKDQRNHIISGLQSGEGGIRTRDTLRYTRFPGARVRPDYATSPSARLSLFGAKGIIPNPSGIAQD